jgi:hypothetical protein
MLIIQISSVEAGNGATNAYGSNLGNQAGFEQQVLLIQISWA